MIGPHGSIARRNHPVSYTHLTLPAGDLGEISVVAGSFKKKKTKKTHVSSRAQNKSSINVTSIREIHQVLKIATTFFVPVAYVREITYKKMQ